MPRNRYLGAAGLCAILTLFHHVPQLPFCVSRGVISPAECTALSTWLVRHPDLQDRIEYDTEGFAETPGMVVKFRDREVETIFAEPAMSSIRACFEAMRAAGERLAGKKHTIFVMNFLVQKPGTKGLGWHCDAELDTIDIKASAVSVLYLQGPVRGGELTIRTGGRVYSASPDAGTMVTFDGACSHRVLPFSEKTLRLSVVLEGYAVDPTSDAYRDEPTTGDT